MTNIYIELFGYLGSTLVVVSMLMASVVKLRVINMIGSVISASYALIIGSFPLVLMNVCLIAINAYNLVRLLKVTTATCLKQKRTTALRPIFWGAMRRISATISRTFWRRRRTARPILPAATAFLPAWCWAARQEAS